MATPVIMPRQGQSVESCIISTWHKKAGDKVQEGDLLFTYETDKATFEEQAKVSGTLLAVFFEEGDDVPCLTTVCVIGNEGEDANVFNPNGAAAGPATTAPAASENTSSAQPESPAQHESTSSSVASVETLAVNDIESLKISPRARKLAEKSGIDYRYATPTGPEGRIIERDVQALKDSGVLFTQTARDEHLKGGTGLVAGSGLGGRITTVDLASGAKADVQEKAQAVEKVASTSDISSSTPSDQLDTLAYEDVKLPNIRKVIAKAMQASLSNTAQLTLNTSFDATNIIAYRNALKSGQERLALENITINDIILYAVSRTLLNHASLNAHFLDDKIRYFKNVHLGVAVDTDRGLMVPTIMNANLKSLNDISREVKQLAKECQSGTINPDKIKNGTFTISNLGTLDIESFTPILNPPQTGILGVNTFMQKVREVDGKFVSYTSMNLSLTFDHKALDGAPAARFLKELKTNLENFTALLAR